MSAPGNTAATSGAADPDLDFASTEALRYQRPELPPLDAVADYYALAEEARFYSNGGPCHERLAERLAEYLGGGVCCLPVSNCTIGLMVVLREICGRPAAHKRLVAVPSFTFTATACAIEWAGFQPLFVDVEPESWQLDPAALSSALERHGHDVAAVLGCSSFGSAPPTALRDGWRAACAQHDVALLIDSAAGFGALDDRGRRIGGLGDTEIFSFHATKPFAIGEGGMIATADSELADRLRGAINFGIDSTTRTSTTAGLNGKLSELQSAMALAMYDRFDDALRRRRATAQALQERFARHPVKFQRGSEGSTWQVLQLLVPDAAARRRATTAAHALAIETRTCFDPPLHRHPAFAGATRADSLAVTESLAERALSLPLANTLGERQIARLAHLLDVTFEGTGGPFSDATL